MPKIKSDQNSSILEYALSHLQREKDEIQAKIEHILGQLGMSSAPAAPKAAKVKAEVAAPAEEAAAGGTRKKRVLSASARKRIALAQKKRWAEHRKAKGL